MQPDRQRIALPKSVIRHHESKILIEESSSIEETQTTVRFFNVWADLKRILIERGELLKTK